MLDYNSKLKLSAYADLYDVVVPKDNKFRKIDELIDFSFVFDELKDKYCSDNGRKAVDPIILFKYLMIKVIDEWSDVDVVEHSMYDMSYKRFLGLNPEDGVIDPSLLTKFRRNRLKDVELLDLLIGKTVGLAVDKGIIKTKTIIVDSTHSVSKFNPISPINALKTRSKALRRSIYEWDEELKGTLPVKNEDDDLEHEMQYSEALMQHIACRPEISEVPSVKRWYNYLQETVDDIKFHRSASFDEEARIGHKTADSSFFGYKTHIALSPERIITAATVTTGEKGDGPQLPELVEKTERNGYDVDTVVGDSAYSGKDNLSFADSQNIDIVARLNPVITQGNLSAKSKLLDEFIYNKDADRYACPAGHLASQKSIHHREKEGKSNAMRYRWSEARCKDCPRRNDCLSEGSKSKSITVRILNGQYERQIEFEKTEKYKLLSRERYKIEAKNSELKNIYGYNEAESYGLSAMQLQGAVTIFVVNLKRIINMMGK
jgi:transposase